MTKIQLLTIFAALSVCVCAADRPPYASGRPYPEVLKQNLPSTTTATFESSMNNRLNVNSTTYTETASEFYPPLNNNSNNQDFRDQMQQLQEQIDRFTESLRILEQRQQLQQLQQQKLQLQQQQQPLRSQQRPQQSPSRN